MHRPLLSLVLFFFCPLLTNAQDGKFEKQIEKTKFHRHDGKRFRKAKLEKAPNTFSSTTQPRGVVPAKQPPRSWWRNISPKSQAIRTLSSFTFPATIGKETHPGGPRKQASPG